MHESNSSPVITTKRRHSAAFKRKLLELIEQPGASVAGVALERGVNANLLFKWRRAPLGSFSSLILGVKSAPPLARSFGQCSRNTDLQPGGGHQPPKSFAAKVNLKISIEDVERCCAKLLINAGK